MMQKKRLLMGKPLADALLARAAAVVPALPRLPSLAIVMVGHHPASEIYVAKKQAACHAAGIPCDVIVLRESEGEAAFHAVLRALAHDVTTSGVMVQLPLPAGWQVQAALDVIPAVKDVDGLATETMETRLYWPATPLGVMRLLDSVGFDFAGVRACVVGQSTLVGKPLAEMLERRGCVVDRLDKDTPHPAVVAARADLLCSAVGGPDLIGPDWVKEGAVVVDIGTTRVAGKLVGDVSVLAADKARMVTPVPGGVGPLTVASLLTNVVDSLCRQVNAPLTEWVV